MFFPFKLSDDQPAGFGKNTWSRRHEFGARLENLLEDASRVQTGKKPVGAEAFEVGRNMATSPGKVFYRNALIELIQYAPTIDVVRPEPILIVPVWIMKYYILDLGDENSLVRYLTSQGFTVFMVSWKNPDAEDRDIGLEDYLSLGVMDAVSTVEGITKASGIHAMEFQGCNP